MVRSLHKQGMIKQQIYKDILARKTGLDYSPIMCFETILVNMDEAKPLSKKNQPEKHNENNGSDVAPSSTNG